MASRPYSLDRLNGMSRRRFENALQDLFPDAPWIVAQAANCRPFSSIGVMHDVVVAIIRDAPEAERTALLSAQPDPLADMAMVQALVGPMNDQDRGNLSRMVTDYRERHGWPLVLSLEGLTATGLMIAVARRLGTPAVLEVDAAIQELARAARGRLAELVSAHGSS